MKNRLILAIIFAFLSAGLVSAQTDLADYLPEGAIAYIETDDLAGLLQQSEASGLPGRYLKSGAYENFSNSKLALKLGDRIRSLEDNTGFGLTYDRLKNLAGTETALALYDIGELRMTFITRIGFDRVSQSSLWPLRESFDTRKLADGERDYYVKEDPYGRASLAFAFIDDLLIISTDITRFEASMELVAGDGQALATAEAFSTAASHWTGDALLRLYLDQSAIAETPYFRSYWVLGNQSSLDHITWAAIQLEQGENALVERRRFGIAGSESWQEQGWVNELNRSPVLLAAGALDQKNLAVSFIDVFSGVLKSARSQLTETLEAAQPWSMATIIERNGDGRAGVTYAIRLGNPQALDTEQFESLIAGAIGNSLLPQFARKPHFIDAGNVRALEMPLVEQQMPAYSLEGDVLLFQPRRYLPASSISRFSGMPEGVHGYSFIDLGVARSLIAEAGAEIEGLQVWNYSDGKQVTTESVPALLELAGGVSWIEKVVRAEADGFSEVISYQLQ